MLFKKFPVQQQYRFLQKALYWANYNFDHFLLLNGNNFSFPYEQFPFELAIGKKNYINSRNKNNNSFKQLQRFTGEIAQSAYGFITYDAKNEIEELSSNNPGKFNLPNIFFFEPEIVIYFSNNQVSIETFTNIDIDEIYNKINCITLPELSINIRNAITNTSHEDYLDNLKKIKNHIKAGDIYEINYCINFYADNVNIDPVETWLRLNKRSPMPFSSFLKKDDFYMIGASPERFLKKSENVIISQPIKGTIKRSNNRQKNENLKAQLRNSEKEIAENMMIVDLVRNDLARSCLSGTVKAEELFGIYGFQNIYQMISTIIGKLKPDMHFTDAIRNAFPMGSMTGAPKIMAMELIERYENFKRELFSGTVGKIDRNGNFDLNVVIRSIFYEHKKQYLSYAVGGAITFDSNAEKEYDECMLKANAIQGVLKELFNEKNGI